MHVKDIGEKIGIDGEKLGKIYYFHKAQRLNCRIGRCLRYLASMKYIFQELSPDVFANNRISAILDTGKSYTELKTAVDKYDKANPIPAIIGAA
jgi:hypothetical protein